MKDQHPLIRTLKFSTARVDLNAWLGATTIVLLNQTVCFAKTQADEGYYGSFGLRKVPSARVSQKALGPEKTTDGYYSFSSGTPGTRDTSTSNALSSGSSATASNSVIASQASGSPSASNASSKGSETIPRRNGGGYYESMTATPENALPERHTEQGYYQSMGFVPAAPVPQSTLRGQVKKFATTPAAHPQQKSKQNIAVSKAKSAQVAQKKDSEKAIKARKGAVANEKRDKEPLPKNGAKENKNLLAKAKQLLQNHMAASPQSGEHRDSDIRPPIAATTTKSTQPTPTPPKAAPAVSAETIAKAKESLKKGDWLAAKIQWSAIAQVRPEDRDAANNAYVCSVQTRDWSSAEKALQHIAKLEPTRVPELSIDLGRILYEQGEYARAKQLLTTAGDKTAAVKQNFIHRTLLLIAIAQSDDAGAEAEYKALLAAAKSDTDSKIELADLLWKVNKRDESVNLYKQAQSERRNDADLQAKIGYVLLYHGDFAGAVTAYRQAVTLKPLEPKFRSALKFCESKLKASTSNTATTPSTCALLTP